MSPPRKCARRLCPVDLDAAGRAPQARYCSPACKQADFRERHDPTEAPSQLWELPDRALADAVEVAPGSWRVAWPDGRAVEVAGRSRVDAVTRARWALGRLIGRPGEGDAS